jgi:short-subunit dehydrogenase
MSDSGKLTGHSALIAGAAGDIGLAVAKLLAAEGCRLHLADLKDQKLEEIAEELFDLHEIEAEIYSTDLSESINAAALALECEDVGILINTFGSVPVGNIETLDSEDWQAGFELRVLGAINLSREVLEGMIDLASGIIVNVGGGLDDRIDDQLCLQTINATLSAFSENLDKQTKREGIRVLTFLPDAEASADDNATALTRMILGKLSS